MTRLLRPNRRRGNPGARATPCHTNGGHPSAQPVRPEKGGLGAHHVLLPFVAKPVNDSQARAGQLSARQLKGQLELEAYHNPGCLPVDDGDEENPLAGGVVEDDDEEDPLAGGIC